jgi:hypothetical protein
MSLLAGAICHWLSSADFGYNQGNGASRRSGCDKEFA